MDDAARWKEVSELAGLAADTGPEERNEILSGVRPDLRPQVESLLRHLECSGPLDSDPGEFLSRALSGAGTVGDWEVGLSPGQRIGPFEIISELGEGGMGVVFLARRADVGFEQKVAIKIARFVFRSHLFEQRFLEEQRILGRLDHPGIARLIDGGITDGGIPYLVMQYVEGQPIHTWWESASLSEHGRLEVFLKVCAAVQYAHEHLVVHRDLKPANILVTAAGDPVLLDFGTARLVREGRMDSDGGAGEATRTEFPMMTLRYASPEQVGGMAGSTRSDVYSLSVILHELLLRRSPYPAVAAGSPASAVMRDILDSDQTLAIDPILARAHQIRPDLQAILLKGLEKSPELRYSSAGSMADDIRRYLRGEPVWARKHTWPYRAGKFIRRHKAWAGSALIVAIAMAVATWISAREARIANRERDKAQAVAAFAERLLGASRESDVTPLAVRGRDLKVIEIIDDAARTVGSEFAANPEVESGLRSTIGSTYMALGEFAKAREHVDRAVELNERIHGRDHVSTARALTARGRLRMAAGDYAGARLDLTQSLATGVRENSPNLSFLYSLLGETSHRLGDSKAARINFEIALDAMRKRFGDHHVATATVISNLGVVAEDSGDLDAAERRFREAVQILRSLPDRPPNLHYALLGLNRALYFRGKLQEAKALCEEAYQLDLEKSGERHRNTAIAMLSLAFIQAHLGEPGALAMGLRAVELQRQLYPEDHFEIGRGLTQLGRIQLLVRRSGKEAEANLAAALRILRKAYPNANWRTAEASAYLGAAQVASGLGAAGSARIMEGLREMQSAMPAGHPRVREIEALVSTVR